MTYAFNKSVNTEYRIQSAKSVILYCSDAGSEAVERKAAAQRASSSGAAAVTTNAAAAERKVAAQLSLEVAVT